MAESLRLHHVTAITGNLARNVDFYTNVLGLRLVKITVNYADFQIFHLYYGDATGTPGTLISFFVWPGANRGREGVEQINSVAFAVPPASIGEWMTHLLHHGVRYTGPTTEFGQTVLHLRDFDGLKLTLVADDNVAADDVPITASANSPLAVQRLHGVTLWSETQAATGELLATQFDYQVAGEEDKLRRYATVGIQPTYIIIRDATGFWPGDWGAGIIHHAALRLPDEEALSQWQIRLTTANLSPTPILDRTYFQSVYFREPGGITLELATDGPGMTVNETLDTLGTTLQLPPYLYPSQRTALADQLRDLLPGFGAEQRDPFA